jgi:hypothetical protein
MGKKARSESGIRIRDEHPGSYFRELRNNFLGQKYFNLLMRIRNLFDPGSGMEKFGPGIRDKHPGSATLVFRAKTFQNYESFSLSVTGSCSPKSKPSFFFLNY